MNINVDPNKQGIEGLNMDVTTNAQEVVQDFALREQENALESHEPALQSINVNQTRSKTISESHKNDIGMTNQHNVVDGRVVSKEIADFEALQIMTATKFKDPRETAYQKLDVLFTAPCH